MPWAWGLNGARCLVVASVLAIFIGSRWGFSAAFLTGAWRPATTRALIVMRLAISLGRAEPGGEPRPAALTAGELLTVADLKPRPDAPAPALAVREVEESERALFFAGHYAERRYHPTGWRLRLERDARVPGAAAPGGRLGRVLSVGCGDGAFELMLAEPAPIRCSGS